MGGMETMTFPVLGGAGDVAYPYYLFSGHGVTYVDGPDTVHVTPWGGLVIAEDGDGDNHLVGGTEETGA